MSLEFVLYAHPTNYPKQIVVSSKFTIVLRIYIHLIGLSVPLFIIFALLVLSVGRSQADEIIAFVNYGVGGETDIFVADLARGLRQNLTRSPAADLHPDWSPDGTKIVFSSTRDGFINLHMMDASGRNVSRLTDNQTNATTPDWSPDGTKIAFAYSYPVLGAPDIYIMDLETGDLLRVTANRLLDQKPDWSPDGNYLIYQSNAGGISNLYIRDAAGNPVRRVTQNNRDNASASWSPDGKYLASQTNLDGVAQIQIINLETDETQFYTDSTLFNLDPVWIDRQTLYYVSYPQGNPVIYELDVESGETEMILEFALQPAIRPIVE